MQQEVGELLKLVDELESVKVIGKRIRAHIRWKDKGNAMAKELFFLQRKSHRSHCSLHSRIVKES
jgi:hypothetical protein